MDSHRKFEQAKQKKNGTHKHTLCIEYIAMTSLMSVNGVWQLPLQNAVAKEKGPKTLKVVVPKKDV